MTSGAAHRKQSAANKIGRALTARTLRTVAVFTSVHLRRSLPDDALLWQSCGIFAPQDSASESRYNAHG
jgi:hypothetical protein